MTDEAEQFHENLDRFLDGRDPISGDPPRDPLLQIAGALKETLAPARPSPEFRARLKAELLERYTDNVRPFPTPVPEKLPPPPAARNDGGYHWRGLVAAVLATAAAVALLVGYYNGTHPHGPSVSRVAVVLTSTPVRGSAPPLVRRVHTPVTTRTVIHGNPADDGNPQGPSAIATRSPRPQPNTDGNVAQDLPPSPTRVASTPTPRLSVGHPTHSTSTVPPTPTAGFSVSPTVSAPMVALGDTPTAQPTRRIEQMVSATPVPPSATSSVSPPSSTPIPPSPSPRPTAQTSVASPIVPVIAVRPSGTNTPVATAAPSFTPAAPAATKQPTATLALPTSVPSDTPMVATATAHAQPATARPTVQPVVPSATATQSRPSFTPTASAPSATVTPRVTATPESATTVPTLIATATPQVPSPSATSQVPASAATDTPQPPAPTSTPISVTNTPVAPPISTAQPTMVALASSSPTPGTGSGPIHVPAAQPVGATSSVTPSPSPTLQPNIQFAAPLPSTAGIDSPISATTPLTPGVMLLVSGGLPAAPGQLPVFTYAPRMSGKDALVRDSTRLLSYFDLVPAKGLQARTATASASTVVSADGRRYAAYVSLQPAGFHLTLRLLTLDATAPYTQTANFNAVANALAYLRAHRLAADGLQKDAVTTLANNNTVVSFSQYVQSAYKVAGAGATVTFNPLGVLIGADVRFVDTSSSPVVPGISAGAALAQVAAGQGLVHGPVGMVLDATATIGGTSILYVPLTQFDGTQLYEPVYEFSGSAGDGSPFQVYVPAIDRAYLR